MLLLTGGGQQRCLSEGCDNDAVGRIHQNRRKIGQQKLVSLLQTTSMGSVCLIQNYVLCSFHESGGGVGVGVRRGVVGVGGVGGITESNEGCRGEL